ncbi:MAG: UDP-N-acetylmuramate dehydrogenase [Coraliomargaritaceae bacterium]
MGTQKRILFLGVGGAGMAPLAMWLAGNGESIFGYDDYFKQGALAYLRNSEVNLLDEVLIEDIKSYDQIVYSNAIAKSHRLLKEAERLNIACLKRGEKLAELAGSKKFIAIVGSHGKTTTSALIGHTIRQLGLPINFIVGGFYQDATAPYYVCDSEWLLAEVDESDGTINGFNPEISVVLNLDWDHIDYYQDFDSLKKVFEGLLLRTKSKILIEALNFEAFSSREAFPGECVFIDTESVIKGNTLDAAPLLESGNGMLNTDFNCRNQMFAEGVLGLFESDLPKREILFKSFPGVERRQGILLSKEQLVVIEDYAHHPSEIDILIKAIRSKSKGCDLTVIFQPHRYSRTKALNQDFVKSLSSADKVFILPVYSAFEAECEGGMTEDLVSAFGSSKPGKLSFNQFGLEELLSYSTKGSKTKKEILLFIGAGSINEFAHAFCSLYEGTSKQSAWLDYTKKKVSSDCVLNLSENLASKTTFKIGGLSEYYAEPSSISDVLALIQSSQLFGLPYFCLGRGSNILVADSGYRGLVIRFNHKNWQKIRKIDDSHIWVGCGARLKNLCGKAAQLGFSGFEFLEGIPGSLGGALRMNAGAMGRWTFDVVERVLMVNDASEVKELGRDEFTIEYRRVPEIANGIALGAILKLKEVETSDSIRERMDSYSDVRKGSQPIAPSAGCIFKNPENDYAGRLIDDLGLKNTSVGGAAVSDKHGNFIVNRGGSTSKDVQSLIALIQKRVKEAHGIDLEPEVLLLGDELPNTNTLGDEGASK